MSAREPALTCASDSPGGCGVCGDVAIAGEVRELGGGIATILTEGGPLTAALDLVDDVRVGDEVLVHQGFIIARVTP